MNGPHARHFHSMAFALLAPLLGAAAAWADSSSSSPAERLGAATTWMYQIQGLEQDGAVSALAATEYPLLVVEPGNNMRSGGYDTAAMLSALRTTPSGRSRVLLAYIDVGQAESYRAYWGDGWVAPQAGQAGTPDFLLSLDPDGWSGNYPVAYWRAEWQALWLSENGIVKTLARLGVDGVYLDWVEGYDDTSVKAAATREGVDAARTMIDFVAAIRAAGRSINPQFLVVAQNAPYLIDTDPDRYAASIDGLGVEDTWYYGDASASWDSPRSGDLQGGSRQDGDYSTANRLVQVRKYQQRGLPVFSIDYCVQAANAARVYREARQAGLRPLVSRVSLSRLTVTPPEAFWQYAFLAGAARADGARRIPISTAGSLQNPAFSPEGWSLLFTAFRGGYNSGAADLLIEDLGGTSPRTLVANGTANVNLPGSCWSRRTRGIVFSSSRDPHDEVYLIPEFGSSGDESQVTSRDAEQAFEPTFSPDGRTVVFESHAVAGSGPGSLVTRRFDGAGGYLRLTDLADDCRQPVWSPAGNLIVYQKRAGGHWEVWVTAPDGTGQRQVTSGAGDKTDPSFSPDGSWIVYSSSEGGLANANLFAIPTAGGSSIRVTNSAGYDGAPSWSPDGRWIAFESSPGDPDGSAGTSLWVIATPTLPVSVGAMPGITNPAPGSTLTSPSVTFTWAAGSPRAAQYWLHVGSSPGGADLYNRDQGSALSTTASGLPTDGSTVYVRLWYLTGGAWQHNDTTFRAMGTPGVATPPAIRTPSPGSTLSGSTATFTWSAGTGATRYWLYVGRAVGAHDLLDSGNLGTSLSATAAGLPTDGSLVWVRLWYLRAGAWSYVDARFTAATLASVDPVLTSPAPGSTLTSSTETFTWSAGAGASQYWLWVGSTPGGYDLFNQDTGASLSVSVDSLPTDGRTIYARLWYLVGGTWYSRDSSFRAAA